MQNSDPLVPFGLAVLILTALLIVVPYLRRKCDVLTAWNVFLLSGAIFIGLGCLEVAYGNFHWPELQWFQPSRGEVQWYMLGATVFYAVLLITYYKFSWARSVGKHFLNKWPPTTFSVLLIVLGLFLAFSTGSFLVGNVPILGSLVLNISHKSAVFATVFAFCYWIRDRRNFLLLALFLGIFAYASLFAMTVFSGRRLLLSIVAAPLICLYWTKWRDLSPRTNLVRLGIATAVAFIVMLFYSTIRYYQAEGGEEQRSFARVIESMHKTSLDKTLAQLSSGWLHYFSQYSVHYSLLTMRLVDTEVVPIEPLNSLVYLAVYPIPRALWHGKPVALGGPRLVNQTLRMPYHTNWGLGVVGNGYQEGGIVVIALYAFLVAVCIRIFDDAMVRQPSNIFLLAILCTCVPHIAAWTRGEICIMTSEIIEAVAFAWGLGIVCRYLIGTAYPVSNLTTQSRAYDRIAALTMRPD